MKISSVYWILFVSIWFSWEKICNLKTSCRNYSVSIWWLSHCASSFVTFGPFFTPPIFNVNKLWNWFDKNALLSKIRSFSSSWIRPSFRISDCFYGDKFDSYLAVCFSIICIVTNQNVIYWIFLFSSRTRNPNRCSSEVDFFVNFLWKCVPVCRVFAASGCHLF